MHLSKKETILTAIGLLVLLGAVFGISWGFSSMADKFKSAEDLTYKSEGPEEKSFNLPSLKSLAETVTLKNDNGRTNMLFLGISGEDYISGDLADTIILLSLNKETQEAHMFSVPRDLWVSRDGQFQKINELYRVAGGTEQPDVEKAGAMRQKMEEITGQPVHYTIIINLEGIKEFVDLVGGVETEEGHKNGEEALFYIRDRSRPGSDFDRMARQQKLIVALIEKIISGEGLGGESDAQMEDLLSTYEAYFSSDISVFQLYQLEGSSKNISTENIEMHTITPAQDNLLYSDYTEWRGVQAYTLHPTAGLEDYSEIQGFINSVLEN